MWGRDVYVPEYEEIKKSDRVSSAGHTCYVERNYWMVNESIIVIICVNEKHEKESRRMLAYRYALYKNKQVIKLA